MEFYFSAVTLYMLITASSVSSTCAITFFLPLKNHAEQSNSVENTRFMKIVVFAHLKLCTAKFLSHHLQKRFVSFVNEQNVIIGFGV